MEYSRAMAALRRRRWIILIAVATCTGLTFAGASRMKREYQASATLMAQDDATEPVTVIAKPIGVEQDRDDLTAKQDRLKTIAAVLNSPAVMEKVISDLNLKTLPAQLQERIEVKEVTSQVLRLSLKDDDAARAGETVNRFVESFVAYYTDLRSRDARTQLAALEKERDEATRNLRLAADRLQRFKQAGNISSLPDQTRLALDQAKTTEEARNEAEAQYREVTAKVSSMQAQLAHMSPNREIRESATPSKMLEKLNDDLIGLKTSLAKELAVHTEEHPNVKHLKEQIAALEKQQAESSTQMQVAVRVIPDTDYEDLQTRLRELTNERDGLASRISRLSSSVGQLQARATGYAGKDVELSPLVQNYTLAEQRLNTVSERLGQIRSAADRMATNPAIAVVDRTGPGNPPLDLTQGRTLRLTAIAFVLSLVACIAMTLGLETADRRVRTVEDVEGHTQLPVISVIPQLPGRREDSLCLTAENDPSSHLAESYHFLANHVLRQTLRAESTVLMGVTARPGQGATTALSNLAVALARAGRKVVLVEADLRRPELHEVFGSNARPGLTDVLQGVLSVSDALMPTQVENLSLLAPGSKVSDPWSLLWKPRMGEVVEDLRSVAQYVIFNVPSATVFPDALGVAPHIDGGILVMRTVDNPNGAEQKVRQWLEDVNVEVMGVVLNGVPAREMESYEYHRTYTTKKTEQRPARPALLPGPALKRAADQ